MVSVDPSNPHNIPLNLALEACNSATFEKKPGKNY